jgi:phospholipid N-methyltransferase
MLTTDILKQCYCEGNAIKLPAYQLDREDYLAVKKSLELIGGKWKGGKVQGFVFNQDPQELLAEIAGGDNRNLKKEYQFFATPDDIARKMARLLDAKDGDKILEPSAGQGALLKAVFDLEFNEKKVWERKKLTYHCYEPMTVNKQFLQKFFFAEHLGDDFLLHDESKKYNRIIANPPFTKNQDIDHIKKMYNCLQEGGRMVTVSSVSWETGNQAKQVQFRDWLDEIGAEVRGFAEGAFKESGTNVRTKLIVINKPVTTKRTTATKQLQLF